MLQSKPKITEVLSGRKEFRCKPSASAMITPLYQTTRALFISSHLCCGAIFILLHLPIYVKNKPNKFCQTANSISMTYLGRKVSISTQMLVSRSAAESASSLLSDR